jgi:hypothetical protein
MRRASQWVAYGNRLPISTSPCVAHASNGLNHRGKAEDTEEGVDRKGDSDCRSLGIDSSNQGAFLCDLGLSSVVQTSPQSSGANPRRSVFSHTARGSTNCSR